MGIFVWGFAIFFLLVFALGYIRLIEIQRKRRRKKWFRDYSLTEQVFDDIFQSMEGGLVLASIGTVFLPYSIVFLGWLPVFGREEDIFSVPFRFLLWLIGGSVLSYLFISLNYGQEIVEEKER